MDVIDLGSLLENTQDFVGPDERVRYVIAGERGLRPIWPAVSWCLLATNRPRIVAVTANRILVMKAGPTRSGRSSPKALLFELPRLTYLGPVGNGWSKLQLGSEEIWIARSEFRKLDLANREAGLTRAIPVSA